MIAAVLGSIVGLILGLTGAGGSIFAVPLLVLGLGQSMTQATPIALLAVCGASTLGAASALRAGLARYRAALLIGIVGSLVSPLGIDIAARASHETLVYVFAAVMLIVATRMFLGARGKGPELQFERGNGAQPDSGRSPVCRLDPQTRRIRWTSPCTLVLSLSGAVTGVLSGALGVGAGFVIVPTLRAATDLSMGASIATSLMAIAIISASAVVAFVLKGGHLAYGVAAPFLAGALAGMLLGRLMAARVSGPRLQRVFASFMALAALAMVFRAIATRW
jgi:uncharacterized membrane protein YfcA